MPPDDIATALTARFGSACQQTSPDAWNVETEELRLLAITSGPWLKLMTPIMPISATQAFIPQMMEANFDRTQEARYAFHQEVVWGVFQYDCAALKLTQLEGVIARLTQLHHDGPDALFAALIETQVTQIILAAKRQGQSLEDTLKTLERFYAEGVMGEMGEANYQQQALSAWRYQLERLWPTVGSDAVEPDVTESSPVKPSQSENFEVTDPWEEKN